MSGPAPGGIGREQLLAQISVLGEVRNAGPRDRRFKQWRQITSTLLQRMWPNDPSRAQEFCRIPFSAPTILPNPRLTQEHFERGCSQADALLTALVHELEGGAVAKTPAPPRPASVAPPVVDVAPVHAPPVAPVASVAPVLTAPVAPVAPVHAPPVVPVAPVRTAPVRTAPVRTAPVVPVATVHAPPAVPVAAPPVVPVVAPPVAPAEPVAIAQVASIASEPALDENDDSAPAAQPRLKDLLGLGDLTLEEKEPASAPAMVEPTRPQPVPAAPPPAPAAAPRRAPAPPPIQIVTAPTAPPPAAASRPDGHALIELAGKLEELGVPAADCDFIRAALIDLGRQADAPPLRWSAVRDAIALSLVHRRLARRLLPLLMPHLDAAA